MRLFFRKENKRFLFFFYWLYSGKLRDRTLWRTESDRAASAWLPRCRGTGPPGLCWGNSCVQHEARHLGMVIKGENSALRQPAVKIDPIRPLTRNPRDPSTHVPHHCIPPRTCARRQETVIATAFYYTRKSQG